MCRPTKRFPKQETISTLTTINVTGQEEEQGMAGKKGKRKRKAASADKLDALRIALSHNDKPSNKFMKAFEGLMRKDGSE